MTKRLRLTELRGDLYAVAERIASGHDPMVVVTRRDMPVFAMVPVDLYGNPVIPAAEPVPDEETR